MRNYLENAPDAIYISDIKGNFLYGNKKAEEMTGYKREEFLGKNFLNLNLLPPGHLLKAGTVFWQSSNRRITFRDGTGRC